MSVLIVIPARWGSTRFPGKPLARLAGRTLIDRSIDLARRATHSLSGIEIVVATDDDRIAEAARSRCAVALTDGSITSGSGRALAAARAVAIRPELVVNLQADAPLMPAAALTAVIAGLRGIASADCVTPVVQLDWAALSSLRDHKRIAPFSGTTCVRDPDGRALWFSKTILPAIRDEAAMSRRHALSPVFRHLGLYGFTFAALARFEALPPSTYERCEGLEQLRMIEAGMAVHTVAIDPVLPAGSGIDTLDDLALAEAFIALHGDAADA